jgi:hypothetical protein
MAAIFPHTGRVDCCVVCAVDDYWRWLDDRRARKERVRAERGADLDAPWVDLGGEG